MHPPIQKIDATVNNATFMYGKLIVKNNVAILTIVVLPCSEFRLVIPAGKRNNMATGA